MAARTGFVVTGRFGQLRFKSLFLIVLAILIIDLAIPDFIPLIDELLLGLLTMLFWRWRKPAVSKTVIEGL
ncbi:MAG: hypothetical protein ACI9BW_004361 [Gammaproteobacteria bacterium]|jgi:hypothetical protein